MVHGELFFMIMGTSEEDGEINRQKKQNQQSLYACMIVIDFGR